MAGPCSGVRVVDLTSMVSGPVATMLLGDQGADVIKVEPMTGDLVRYHPVAGRIRQPRPAARFDKTPAEMWRHAPVLGEHTAELLTELGLDAETLLAQGVVAD